MGERCELAPAARPAVSHMVVGPTVLARQDGQHAHPNQKKTQQFTVQPTSTSVMVSFLTDELRFFTFALDKVCTVRTGWLVGVFLLE
jgi:hypothetical protein